MSPELKVCKNVRGHYRIKTLPKSPGISYGTTPRGHVHTGTTDRTPLPRARPWADTTVCRWMTKIVLCQLNVWFNWKKAKFNKWVKCGIIKTKLTIFMNKTRIPHTSRFDISRNGFSHKNDNFVIALILQMTCNFPRVFKAIYHDEWWMTPCFYVSIDSFYQCFFYINLKDLTI